MRWALLRDGFASANLLALRLGLRDRELARSYLSNCIRLYDELVGHGLKRNDPLSYLHQQGWGASSFDDRLVLPAGLKDDSGTRIDELLILAMVTKVLSPNRVFEIGTYNGRTTSIFALNAPQGATVFTLYQLPPGASIDGSRETSTSTRIYGWWKAEGCPTSLQT